MDAKPDELVIALGSRHVARILEHLHEHALHTDIDFEDVVPGLSGETCLKVWEKCKDEASSGSVTIKSQVQPTEPLHIEDEDSERGGSMSSDAPHSPASGWSGQQDDSSGTTLPRTFPLIDDTDDDADEMSELWRSEDPFFADHARLASSPPPSSNNSTNVVKPVALQAVTHAASQAATCEQQSKEDTSTGTEKRGTVAGPSGTAYHRAPGILSAMKSRDNNIRKRNSAGEVFSATQPTAASKRPKIATVRRASTPKSKKPCGCKHAICTGLDECLVPSSPAV